MKEVARIISEAIKNSDNQEKLAELAGISAKHITKIESAKVSPSIYIVYKLAKVLDTSIDELVKR